MVPSPSPAFSRRQTETSAHSTPVHTATSRGDHTFSTPLRDASAPGTPTFRLKAGRLSPASSKLMGLVRASSTPPDVGYGPRQRASYATDGMSELSEPLRRQQYSKKKSQYFEDAFAYREPSNTAKERVTRDSTVIAEVKLNCQLASENDFLLDLSFQLSEIYQRPESSIMISIAPKMAMLLGGCNEPAYHITITALSCEIAPTKNKRVTYLIQCFMLETLHIRASRGVIRFEGVTDGNLATNGMTAAQEIEDLERRSEEARDNNVLRSISRLGGRSPQMSVSIEEKVVAESAKTKVKRRKSIMAFFKK